MFAEPGKEHQWLDQLVGDWEMSHQSKMPDGTEATTTGKIHCRSLGGMWLIQDYSGETPEGGEWSSIMTLGFDPAINQFVGTFVASMMSHMWSYLGEFDSEGRLLLNAVGPKFDGSGNCNYQDTIEIVSPDCWLMSSAVESDDGQWLPFMNGKQTRVAS